MEVLAQRFRRRGFGVEVSAWRFRRRGFGAEVSEMRNAEDATCGNAKCGNAEMPKCRGAEVRIFS